MPRRCHDARACRCANRQTNTARHPQHRVRPNPAWSAPAHFRAHTHDGPSAARREFPRLGAPPCRPRRARGPTPRQAQAVRWTACARAGPPNPRKRQRARNLKASTWPPSAHHHRRAQGQQCQCQCQRLWLRHSGGHIAGAHSHGIQHEGLAHRALGAYTGSEEPPLAARLELCTGPVGAGLHIVEQTRQVAVRREQVTVLIESGPCPIAAAGKKSDSPPRPSAWPSLRDR